MPYFNTCDKKNIVSVYIYLVIGLVSLFFLSTAARATTVVTMDLDTLVDTADKIVVGRCTHVRSRWSGNKIYTESTIEIQNQLKGSGDSEYTITTLGGTANHPTLQVPVTMSVAHGVSFRAGEEVVVFTKQNRRGKHQVVGLTQGKFVVEDDTNTGKKTIPLGQKKITIESPGAEINNRSSRSISAAGPSPLNGRRAAENAGINNRALVKTRAIGLDEFVTEITQRVRATSAQSTP